jgi:hypothetical protein
MYFMSDEEQQGPKLGGPSLGGGPNAKGPNLKSLKTPALKTPALKTPSLKAVSAPAVSSAPQKSKTKASVNVHELVRKWGVARRRIRDSLQTMMLREIKEKVAMTNVNEVFRAHILSLMQGQLDYFAEMIEQIGKEEDVLSLENLEEEEYVKVSDTVFHNLTEIISEEMERLEQDKPVITEYIDEDLKRFKDARVEPRAAFWLLWYTGLMIQEIRARSEERLEIVLEVMMRYPAAQRRALGVFLNFCDSLVVEFEPFSLEFARINPVYNPTFSGYNMAPWIKPRYGTYSQSYMEYERFLVYYARSFGSVPGNSPDFEGGPLRGYRSWIQRSLVKLEEKMKTSPILVEQARGNSLEGMLAGLQDVLEEESKEMVYDDEGKVTNHPPGIEGVVKFVEWLFHTALNRYTTTNVSTHKEARLSLDMFDFIDKTVRWVNDYGEQIVMDWLGQEEEEEDGSEEE